MKAASLCSVSQERLQSGSSICHCESDAGCSCALQGITHDLGNLMQIRGLKSMVYSALTVAILGAGSAYIAAPYESLTNVLTYTKGPDCIMLWRSIGAALLMLPTWTYNLKARQHSLHVLCRFYCMLEGLNRSSGNTLLGFLTSW